MDGNGRWAARRGLPRTEGHAAGEAALLDAVEGALDLGIPWITMYAFSTENWRRPADEVRYLMGFNESLLLRRRDELHDKGVRIRFAGRRDWRVPKRVLRRMDESIALTAHNRRCTLTMAFNYGGRAEIVDAVQRLVADGVPADKVNEKAIRSRLYFPDQPDPDLVIRTSGEHRISNFLLWQLAYSELVFDDVLWPDFRRTHLFEAVRDFQRRQRRYGPPSRLRHHRHPVEGGRRARATGAGRVRDDSGGVWIATGIVLAILMYGFIVLMDVAGFTAVLPLVVLPPVVLGLIAANSLLNGGRGYGRGSRPAPAPLTSADLDELDGTDGERQPHR
jgi:undecaprenyl diphosphate synthase